MPTWLPSSRRKGFWCPGIRLFFREMESGRIEKIHTRPFGPVRNSNVPAPPVPISGEELPFCSDLFRLYFLSD